MRGTSSETAFLERGSLYLTYVMFIPSRIGPSCLLPSKIHPSSYSCFLPTLPTCSAFTLPTGPPKPPKNSRLEGLPRHGCPPLWVTPLPPTYRGGLF